MKKLFSYMALAAGMLAASSSLVEARELSLTIVNGRVTLIAQDVTVRQILAEWARIGKTEIVNAEKLIGPPVTLELRDVPEGKALETILRSAAGYMLAPRMSATNGSSTFDRIVILATSRAPAVTHMPPAPFTRPQPQPMMPPVDEDEGEPQEAGPPAPTPMPMNMPTPGPTSVPGMQQQPVVPPGGSLTAPRPGQLPPPQVPDNPYQPNPQLRPGGTPPPQSGQRRPGGDSGR